MTSDLTTKAAEIRAGLVERLRDWASGGYREPWDLAADVHEAAALIEQQAAELAETNRLFEATLESSNMFLAKIADTAEELRALKAERDELLREKERLAKKRDEAREALIECEGYFDNRADADCDQDGFVPNKEMRLLAVVREAIASTSQDSGQNLADANSKSPDQPERIAMLEAALVYGVNCLCSVRKNYEEPELGLWEDVTRAISQGNAALAPLGEE